MAQLTYCPVCGHTLGTREEGGRLRQACPNCGYVHYVNPVPAVGILIEKDDGIVLIRRNNPPHKGAWTLPSGFIEADESAEEAAIREAYEETGLRVEIIEMAGVNSFPEGPPVSGIMIFFRTRAVGGELQGGDDASEAAVFEPGNIPRLPFRTHREAIAHWLAQRQNGGFLALDPHLDKQDFLIRAAEPSDSDDLMGLLALIPANRKLPRDERPLIAYRLREAAGLEIFVAQSRQDPPLILGFIALSVVRTLTESWGHIQDMAVLPSYQRRGVGAALLEAVMRRADKLSLQYLNVDAERSNESARAFFASLGLTEERIMRLKLR
jgi:ADP-ribose pyrophosphatase YjhB (NUDIX family)/ribosomal protein S18 acetylase RimI-like enzyme